MRCIPPVNFPVKIYKSLGKLLPPICFCLSPIAFSFLLPFASIKRFSQINPLLLHQELCSLLKGGNEDRGSADMVTLIKCSSKALDHYNL